MIDLNKYIRYIYKYILLVVFSHIFIWLLVERKGIRREEVGFFDNFLFNSIIVTIGVIASRMPNIIPRFVNFLKSRKE